MAILAEMNYAPTDQIHSESGRESVLLEETGRTSVTETGEFVH